MCYNPLFIIKFKKKKLEKQIQLKMLNQHITYCNKVLILMVFKVVYNILALFFVYIIRF